jgi:DNA (cytosine-5)-methyltransferase 1
MGILSLPGPFARGEFKGLGPERDEALTRSGSFWPFWKLVRGLAEAGRSPRTIVLENVYGCLKSRGGKDFAAIGSALSSSDYRFGAIVVNASPFVPQSRPRVFFIAIERNEEAPAELVSNRPDPEWHPQSLVDAFEGMSPSAKKTLGLVDGAGATGPQDPLCRSH